MTNSALFLEHGLISLKDLTGTLIDIEQFRKQEQGTQQHPNDFISDWLSEKPGDAAMLADATPQAQAGKKLKRSEAAPTKRKGLSKAQKAKMDRNLAYKKEKAARAAGTASSLTHDPDPIPVPITISGVPPDPVEDSNEL